ncbi:MAG: hypothetical protein GKR88_08600 [Flavobacteriaceae bacterium]|nr:MAG: hypothetical protein GKR88_08600 [Flavobacteriaceae bacterium]
MPPIPYVLIKEDKVSSGTGFENTYYSNTSFPRTNIEVLTVNYYDDYNFDLAGSVLPGAMGAVYNHTVTEKVKGLPTGNRVRVLESNPAKWITTVNYYNNKGQVIYVYSKNEFLQTTDIVKSNPDFVGKVLETTTFHTKTDDHLLGTQIITDTFTYDHVGRLVSQTQNINGARASEQLLKNTYDELGQLTAKAVGGKTYAAGPLQQVDYTYNVRGWLQNINQDTMSRPKIGLQLIIKIYATFLCT